MKKVFAVVTPVREDLKGCADRREHSRYDTDQLAGLKLGPYSTFVETVDISSTGAKCRISSGFAPFEGDKVNLTFVGGTWRTGIVRWSEAQAFGIEFDRELCDPKEHLHYEHLGSDYFLDIIRLQKLIHDPE